MLELVKNMFINLGDSKLIIGLIGVVYKIGKEIFNHPKVKYYTGEVIDIVVSYYLERVLNKVKEYYKKKEEKEDKKK